MSPHKKKRMGGINSQTQIHTNDKLGSKEEDRNVNVELTVDGYLP